MNDDRHDSADDRGGTRDFKRAVDRLENAVQGVVSQTNDRLSAQATAFVEDAAERLERELGSRRTGDSRRSGSRNRSRSRNGRRRRNRHDSSSEQTTNGYYDSWGWGGWASASGSDATYRTARLYRDTSRQKLCGVCAGLARYWGMETWVVRVMAVTGLIFMPSVIIPAYFIACLLLDKAPDGARAKKREARRRKKGTSEHASPAPELGPALSPRRSLRNVQTDLDQLELKLRRMETHVTSGQYELQRELNSIDQ